MSNIWHYVLASRRSRALLSIAAMQLLLLTSMLRLALHLYAKHTGICRMSQSICYNAFICTIQIAIMLLILSDLFNMIVLYNM